MCPREAVEIARTVLEKLEVVGVLCVEFFVGKNGNLLINELAPRPHNSGHFTFDANLTSQFEQQLRAVCGLPLGDVRQFTPAAMANLLGDLWTRARTQLGGCSFTARRETTLVWQIDPASGTQNGPFDRACRQRPNRRLRMSNTLAISFRFASSRAT